MRTSNLTSQSLSADDQRDEAWDEAQAIACIRRVYMLGAPIKRIAAPFTALYSYALRRRRVGGEHRHLVDCLQLANDVGILQYSRPIEPEIGFADPIFLIKALGVLLEDGETTIQDVRFRDSPAQIQMTGLSFSFFSQDGWGSPIAAIDIYTHSCIQLTRAILMSFFFFLRRRRRRRRKFPSPVVFFQAKM